MSVRERLADEGGTAVIEFIFAAVKVIAVIVFLVVGVLMIFGVMGDGVYGSDPNILDIDNDPEEFIALAGTRGFEAPSTITAASATRAPTTAGMTPVIATTISPTLSPIPIQIAVRATRRVCRPIATASTRLRRRARGIPSSCHAGVNSE